jgi:hypothetical protein
MNNYTGWRSIQILLLVYIYIWWRIRDFILYRAFPVARKWNDFSGMWSMLLRLGGRIAFFFGFMSTLGAAVFNCDHVMRTSRDSC